MQEFQEFILLLFYLVLSVLLVLLLLGGVAWLWKVLLEKLWGWGTISLKKLPRLEMFGWEDKPISPAPKVRSFQKAWEFFPFNALAFNLLLTLTFLYFIYLFIGCCGFLKELENTMMDRMVQFSPTPSIIDKGIPPTVLLAIDDATLDHEYNRNSTSLGYTSRMITRNLIKAAVDGGAKLVIVDIALTDAIHPAGDNSLKEYLEEYALECKKRSTSLSSTCPPIILARSFKRSSGDSKCGENKIAASFLEETVDKSSPYIQWASTRFAFFSSDNPIVRHWRPWEVICDNKDGNLELKEVVPHAALMTVALLNKCTAEDLQAVLSSLQIVQSRKDMCSLDVCEYLAPRGKDIDARIFTPLTFNACGLNTIFDPDFKAEQYRVMYHFPEKGPFMDGAGYPVLQVLSAQNYGIPSPDGKFSGSLQAFKDRIVIVGRPQKPKSGDGQGDTSHDTPIDGMSGVFLLINKIYSLSVHGLIKTAPMSVIFLTVVVLVFINTIVIHLLTKEFIKPPLVSAATAIKFWMVFIIPSITWFTAFCLLNLLDYWLPITVPLTMIQMTTAWESLRTLRLPCIPDNQTKST